MKEINSHDLDRVKMQLSYALGATAGLLSHIPNKGMSEILEAIKLSLEFSLKVLQIDEPTITSVD